MAEQKKEAGGKEKKSFLYDEIGNYFLGSWTKMAVDDTMDFNIETVPKGDIKRRHSTLGTWTSILIWMEILPSYNPSRWTCQTLISQAPNMFLNRSKKWIEDPLVDSRKEN
ncbi:unnamed protein product [Linum tenue]|uniref:Uncharacterized protein n=1 Tax=Linum tenue TaxID=586396 RepID=A0AAV0MFM8_9ROSI|nr:unnamed protein product [Linum tenue]